MNLEKFRITHSTLIEHYQHIEANLEGIYAALSGKSLVEGLHDVEKDSLRRIINEIKKIKSSVFTDEEYARLEKIIPRRNFWCHNCYFDMAFDRKTGGPKKAEDVRNMISDLQDAETLREELFVKKMELFESNREQLTRLNI